MILSDIVKNARDHDRDRDTGTVVKLLRLRFVFADAYQSHTKSHGRQVNCYPIHPSKSSLPPTFPPRCKSVHSQQLPYLLKIPDRIANFPSAIHTPRSHASPSALWTWWDSIRRISLGRSKEKLGREVRAEIPQGQAPNADIQSTPTRKTAGEHFGKNREISAAPARLSRPSHCAPRLMSSKSEVPPWQRAGERSDFTTIFRFREALPRLDATPVSVHRWRRGNGTQYGRMKR